MAKEAEPTLREKIGAVTPIESISYLNLLIYGDPGAGKTYLAGTAQDHPSTAPVLVIDIEGGTTTLRHRHDIDVKQVRKVKELEALYNEIVMDTSDYYKTIVIDSLTELQKLDMHDIMREQYQKKPESTDVDVPSQREWGKSGEHIRKIVRAFRDLQCNTIITALATTERDDNGTITHAPDLPGKLKVHIPGFMDVVGFLHTAEEKDQLIRRLQVAKTRRVIAKDRTATLGSVIESPTIPLMFEKISENGKVG